MDEVEFNFEQRITMSQAELADSFKNIVTKFANKSKLDINKLYGNKMNESEKENKKISIS